MKSRDPSSEPCEVTQFVSEVGMRVRVMRVARGLTQVELAERADISRLTLMSIEAGALTSRFADVARLLWALDDVVRIHGVAHRSPTRCRSGAMLSA